MVSSIRIYIHFQEDIFFESETIRFKARYYKYVAPLFTYSGSVLICILVPAYCELHEVSKLLHGTNTNIRLEVMVEQGDEADSQAEKERVLGSLLNTKQFAKARRYAELMGLSNDHITIKQVRRPQ